MPSGYAEGAEVHDARRAAGEFPASARVDSVIGALPTGQRSAAAGDIRVV